MFEVFGIPVFYLNELESPNIEIHGEAVHHPMFPDSRNLLSAMIEGSKETAVPYIQKTIFLENFLILRIYSEDSASCAIIIGPSIYSAMDEKTVAMLIYDNEVPYKYHQELYDYAVQIPVLDKLRLHLAGMMLHYLIYGEPLEMLEIMEHAKVLDHHANLADKLDLELSKKRENDLLSNDPLHPLREKRLFEAVRIGDKEELLKIYAARKGNFYGVLSNRSQLSHLKNLAITGVTLATRAAIDGGLLWEIAYALSDLHIRRIDEINEVKQAKDAMIEALMDFAEQVRSNREQQVSKNVWICQNYIFKHLYVPITVQDLADVTGLNANYLLQLFRKETNIPIREYIQRERIKEAKKLITYTDLPLSEISSRLCFTDQSYFTKLFKKQVGVTPIQYKKYRSMEIS